jgi:threonine aldolase
VSPRPIDLRSDTVTRPTPGMREAIARAEVGDDTLGDDPSVRALEARIAALLGKEAALLFPSGAMANLAAVALHGAAGEEIIVEGTAHVFDWELGAAAALFGVQLRPVGATDGVLETAAVEAAVRPDSPWFPRTTAIFVENTHNAAGGRVMPIARMEEIRAIAARHGLAVHLDGTRLWNAAAATGSPERAWAALADTVMVTLSKGLGCPVGSLLAGPVDRIAHARRLRRRLGGDMRQAGILASAGLYALDHHRDRLAEDHHRARRLASACRALPGIHVNEPDTNIVMLDLPPALTAAAAATALAARGILLSDFGPRRLRAVTHLDIDDAGIDAASAALRGLLADAPAATGRQGS